MHRTAGWIAIVMLVTPVRAASAQTAVSLSLDDALRRAVEQSPRLADVRARQAGASATVTSRAAAKLPAVTTSASYVRTNHVVPFGFTSVSGPSTVVFPDLPNNYRARAEMTVPLYTAGRADALVESARREAEAVGADQRAIEQDVRLEVIRAYWALVTARQNIAVFERGLERTDAYVTDVRSRVEAGVVSPSDLLSAQALRARQAVRVVQARNAAASAEIDLARLTGVPAGQPILTTTDVAAPMRASEALVGQSADVLVQRAIAGRAEHAGLEQRRAAALATAHAARAAVKPTLGALAAVEPSRPNQRFVPRTDEWKLSWDLGVTVSWPLFDGGRAKADAAVASAQADAVTARLADLDALVAADVRQRLLDVDSGRAALAASDEAVTAATEARRVVEERYRAGVATSTDVLDAQVALLESELERTLLQAALRVNEARLLRALGGV
jgi:outer membrane protein